MKQVHIYINMILFILLFYTSYGQDFTYQKSDLIYKSHNKLNRFTSLTNMVMTDQGPLGIYVNQTANYNQKYVDDNEAILRSFDKKLHLNLEKDFTAGRSNTNVFDLVYSNGKIYCFYTLKNKDILEMNIAEINPLTLEVANEQKNIYSFEYTPTFGTSKVMQVLRSADSSKYIIYYESWAESLGERERYYTRKAPQHLQYVVLDKNMKKIYDKNYEFPCKNKEMKYKGFVAGNDGSLNILYYFYPGGNNEDKKDKLDGETVSPYELKFRRVDDKSDKEYSISIFGKFIETITVEEWPGNNQYIIGGIYKDNYKDKAIGVFMAKVSGDENTFKIMTSPFPSEINKNIPENANFYNPGMGPREGIQTRLLQPLKFVRSGNAMYMFSQYYWLKSKVVMGSVFTYITGDILVTRFDNSGKINTSNIPLPSIGQTVSFESSNIFFNNNNLYLMLGMVGNKKEGEFKVLKIDADGKLTIEDIFNNVDQDGYGVYGNDIIRATEKDFFREGSNDFAKKCYWFKLK